MKNIKLKTAKVPKKPAIKTIMNSSKYPPIRKKNDVSTEIATDNFKKRKKIDLLNFFTLYRFSVT